MSGVIKALKKVFKATVVKPIKLTLKTDHKVAMKIWHTPILRYIAIAVAIYFTAGAAAAYFGAAGAAGGTAAAGTAAAAGGTAAAGTGAAVGTAAAAGAGTSFAAGAAVGTAGAAGAAGTTALAGAAGATTLGTVTVTATVGGAATGGTLAGTIAAASVGAAAGVAASSQAAHTADHAMQKGQGAVTGTPQGMQEWGSTGNTTASASEATDLPTVNVSADVARDVGSGYTSATYADAVKAATTADLLAGAGQAQGVDNDRFDFSKNPDGSPKSFYQKAKDKVADTFGQPQGHATYDENGALDTDGLVGPGVPGAVPASGSKMGTFEKVMLLKTAVDMASGWAGAKPQTQPQYSGRNPGGQGGSMGIHTINNGFGLATGGHQPPPTGVPPALRTPGASARNYAGSLSDAALATSPSGTAGNLGQAAANQAGVGGLVPQGAVNYMGNG